MSTIKLNIEQSQRRPEDAVTSSEKASKSLYRMSIMQHMQHVIALYYKGDKYRSVHCVLEINHELQKCLDII